MDPASAFSLACGVIQVVQLSCKLIGGVRELRDKGSLERNRNIQEQTSQLHGLRTALQSQRPTQPISAIARPEDCELVEIAGKCDDTARKILDELAKLTVPTTRGLMKAVKKSTKAYLSIGTIERLREEMRGYQQALDTRIMISLRRNMNNAAFEQSEGFKTMHESMRNMALTFKSGHTTSFDQLALIIRTETQQIRDQIVEVFQTQDARQARDREEESAQKRQMMNEEEEQELRQKFLDSLSFPEILNREHEIDPAYAETFQWIFDQSGLEMRPWDNFVEWLETGSGTYWVKGKAGSGKSTLMRFICEDSRTEWALRTWAKHKELLTPTFFFWAAGSKLQQSVEGFLRSFLLQLCDRHNELIPQILQQGSIFSKRITINIGWTTKRLLDCMEIVLSELSSSTCICLFVDGLDEFDGDYDRVIPLIQNFAKSPNFKCCFSSRPEKDFETEFELSKQLRLQDLTREDIQKYVDRKLVNFEQVKQLPSERVTERHRLRDIIVGKADGVFLWVRLAVRSQILGIRNGDPLELLFQRLDDLPEDVERIYCKMLGNIDEHYHKEAAWYLATSLETIDAPELFHVPRLSTILTFTLAKYGLDENLHLSHLVSAANVVSKCVLVKERLVMTCAGLLEVREQEKEETPIGLPHTWLSWEPDSVRSSYRGIAWNMMQVQFCHRSALDFFKVHSKGQQFLHDHALIVKPKCLLQSALSLVHMTLCQLDKPNSYMMDHACDMMWYASKADPEAEGCLDLSFKTLNYFNDILQSLHRDHFNYDAYIHWCQDWFPRPSVDALFAEGGYLRPIDFPFPPHSNPDDLLSLAAFSDVGWYVQRALRSQAITSEKATQLGLCTIIHVDKYVNIDNTSWGEFAWYIYKWQQIEVLKSLTKFGLDLTAHARSTIWSEILQYVFQDRFEYHGYNGREMIPTGTDRTELIWFFINVGANLNEVTRLRLRVGTDAGIRFDVPLSMFLACHSQRTGRSTRYGPCDAAHQLKEPLVVSFYSSRGDRHIGDICDIWHFHGLAMSAMQVQTIVDMLIPMYDDACRPEDQVYFRTQLSTWFFGTFLDECSRCRDFQSHGNLTLEW